jgi:hypothetical protein
MMKGSVVYFQGLSCVQMQASLHYGFGTPTELFTMALHLQGWGVPKNRPYGISVTIPISEPSCKTSNIVKGFTSWPYNLMKSYGSDNCAYFPVLLARRYVKLPEFVREFLVFLPSKKYRIYLTLPTKPKSPSIQNLASFYVSKMREAYGDLGYEIKIVGNSDTTILNPKELAETLGIS